MTIDTEQLKRVCAEADLDRQLRAVQIATLENWATEMERSAKTMRDYGEPNLAAGNEKLAEDLKAGVRTIFSLLTRIEVLEGEREGLHLAICGGEDAPGYAASLSHEQIVGVLKDNYASWKRDSELAWDGETANTWKARALTAEAELSRVKAEGERMRGALERIERWFGEFPKTSRKWEDGTPMSYATLFGSNGERDFMRGIARAALQPQQGAPEEGL